MKKVDLRLATRLSIGKKINEAGRRRINLHDVALALGVSERTVRNWCNQAKKDVPKMGRPSHSQEVLDAAKRLVFTEMDKQCSPGWRPIAEALRGQVSVRLAQQFVREYKQLKKMNVTQKRMEVIGKNVIWSMDGAFTKENGKIENQVIKDRGTRFWVGHKKNQVASKSQDVVSLLKESFKKYGKPLVLTTDNGSAYKNRKVCSFLNTLKIVHLKSLPRTPQHNGSVEVGIKELREIMRNGDIDLKVAIEVANARLRKYGRKWNSSLCMYENAEVAYNKNDRESFFRSCDEKLSNLKIESKGYRARRMKERELVFAELAKRGLVTEWKMTKNG